MDAVRGGAVLGVRLYNAVKMVGRYKSRLPRQS